jgi:molybdopterin synthase catalytic subunit
MDTEASGITVRVRAFALVRQAIGTADTTIRLPPDATVSHLLDRLAADCPAVAPLLDRIVVTVNQRFAEPTERLASGDEVAVFPPVSGGAFETHVALTQETIDSSALVGLVTEPGAGAVVAFAGVVRDHNLGRQVRYLEYEAYPEMAEAKLLQVVTEARKRWPSIRRVAVEHRVGRLEIGETAVLVAVGAPHRDDGAFEAARYAIDRIKEIVPIWKKEGWADGAEWLEGDYRPRPGE